MDELKKTLIMLGMAICLGISYLFGLPSDIFVSCIILMSSYVTYRICKLQEEIKIEKTKGGI